jgi:broad specificity phosphatase PhoE
MDNAEKNYCTLYVARHGQTQWNEQKLMQGHKDSPLTEQGKEQARQLGQKLKHISFDAVFSSDLGRTQHTAEIAVAERGLAIATSELIRERRYGDFEGKPVSEFVGETKKWLAIFEALGRDEQENFSYAEGVENYAQVTARVLLFLRGVAAGYPGKTVLVVTHGGILRALLSHLGSPLALNRINNSAYIRLRSDGVDFFIEETDGITHQPDDSDVSVFAPTK